MSSIVFNEINFQFISSNSILFVSLFFSSLFLQILYSLFLFSFSGSSLSVIETSHLRRVFHSYILLFKSTKNFFSYLHVQISIIEILDLV